jgi:hypothetical protein
MEPKEVPQKREIIDLMNTQNTVQTQKDGYEIDPLVAKADFVSRSSDPMAFENELVDYGDSSMEEFNDRDDFDYRGHENRSSLGSVYSDTRPEFDSKPGERVEDWTIEPRTKQQLSVEEERLNTEREAIWEAEYKKWEDQMQEDSKAAEEKQKSEERVENKSRDWRKAKRQSNIKFQERAVSVEKAANDGAIDEKVDCSKFRNEAESRSDGEGQKKDKGHVGVSNTRVVPPSPRIANVWDGLKVLPLQPGSQTPFIEVWNAKRKAEEDKMRLSDENFEKKQKKRAEEELREVAMRKAKEAAQVKELELRRATLLKKAKKIQSYDMLLAVKRKEYEQMTTMHAELEQKLRYEKRIVDALQVKDQEAAREVIGLRKASPVTARAPPVVLDQFMGRLVQNGVRVCDYGQSNQFSS